MRSLPNCKIDFAAAERMYQATVKLMPCEGGNRDHGEIIGAYLGWALDDIERLQAYIAWLEAAYLRAEEQRLAWCKNYKTDPNDRWIVIDMDGEHIEADARESLEQIKAGEQG